MFSLILPDLEGALPELRKARATPNDIPAQPKITLKEVSTRAAEEAEKEVILRALKDANWNCKQVARELDVCYKTLLNKLRKWQISARPHAGGQRARAASKSVTGT